MNIFYYFFIPSPGAEMKYYIPLTIIAIALIVGALIFSQIYKQKKKEDLPFKKLFKNTAKITFILGLVLGFLILVRYEGIPYFSMRIWLYLSLLTTLYFTCRYIKIYKINYLEKKKNTPKEEKNEKKQTYSAKKNRKK